jgi:hypothetical protein
VACKRAFLSCNLTYRLWTTIRSLDLRKIPCLQMATLNSSLHRIFHPLQVSPAYSYSSAHGSPFAKTEMSHAIKPRRLPQLRPSTNRHSAIRVFSLPEDSISATGKAEVTIVQRVVSMPEPRLAGGQLAESSMSTEGFDGSMLSGGSFLSATDITTGICFSKSEVGHHPSYAFPPVFSRFGADH